MSCKNLVEIKFIKKNLEEVKVSKSQKQFFLKLYCPKNEQKFQAKMLLRFTDLYFINHIFQPISD